MNRPECLPNPVEYLVALLGGGVGVFQRGLGSLGVSLHLTYREWHQLINGFYRGFTSVKGRGHPEEDGVEKHYWRAGFVFGYTLKLLLLFLLFSVAF
jgi:hypothetical protein